MNYFSIIYYVLSILIFSKFFFFFNLPKLGTFLLKNEENKDSHITYIEYIRIYVVTFFEI